MSGCSWHIPLNSVHDKSCVARCTSKTCDNIPDASAINCLTAWSVPQCTKRILNILWFGMNASLANIKCNLFEHKFRNTIQNNILASYLHNRRVIGVQQSQMLFPMWPVSCRWLYSRGLFKIKEIIDTISQRTSQAEYNFHMKNWWCKWKWRLILETRLAVLHYFGHCQQRANIYAQLITNQNALYITQAQTKQQSTWFLKRAMGNSEEQQHCKTAFLQANAQMNILKTYLWLVLRHSYAPYFALIAVTHVFWTGWIII